MNVITHTFVGLKCLTETKIQILCDHVSHTRLHTVEMGCQMVKLWSAHIVGPTMCVNLNLALIEKKKTMICSNFRKAGVKLTNIFGPTMWADKS